jgi:hypothetical protein
MTPTLGVQTRFDQALNSLMEKVRQDPNILAAVLLGSLSYDTVWEKSDIDLYLVTDELKQKETDYCLVEDGICIHAHLATRGRFQKFIEGAVRGGFIHSMMSRGRLLFTRDETLRELFDRIDRVGARDREIQLLNYGSMLIPGLIKAEKWLRVKQDPEYAFLWIMKWVEVLAIIEVLLQGEVPAREVIHQALRLNPKFFRAVYCDLIHGEKSAEAIGHCLALMRRYLMHRVDVLFGPVLAYLEHADGVRCTSELNHYFKNPMGLSCPDAAYEWLADQGVIEKVATPVRLTPRSRVDVQEAAYFYSGEPVVRKGLAKASSTQRHEDAKTQR